MFIAFSRISLPELPLYLPVSTNLFFSDISCAITNVESYSSWNTYFSANRASPMALAKWLPNGSNTGKMILPEDDNTV